MTYEKNRTDYAETLEKIVVRQKKEIERWKAFAKYLYVTSNNKIPECYQDLFNEMGE